MENNVVQLPGFSEREWKKFDKILREAFEKLNTTDALTEEISRRMKETFLKAYREKQITISKDEDVYKIISSATQQTASHFYTIINELIIEIAIGEVKLYTVTNENGQNDL